MAVLLISFLALIILAWSGLAAYCVLACIDWASKPDGSAYHLDTLEPRALLSALKPFHGEVYSRVMGPNLPEIVVANKATAPGQQFKQPPTITPVVPPPPPPAPTIVEWADPSDIGQRYYYDPAVYSLFGDAGGPLVSAGAQRFEENCWWVGALKSEAFANPGKLTLAAKDDPRGGWDVELYGQWGHIQDGFPWFSTQPTADDALYPLVFEKAFACYKGNYTQTFGPGWMTTEIWAIGGSADGSGWTAANVSMPISDAAFTHLIDTAHANNIGLTIGTGSYTTTLVASHAYVVTGYAVVNGATYYHLENPWEFDDADVTLSQFQSDVAGIVSAN